MSIRSTISFAGNPNINAIRINPSRPIRLAKGLRKAATWPTIAKLVIDKAGMKLYSLSPFATRKTVAIAIKVGNLPLQGTKLVC